MDGPSALPPTPAPQKVVLEDGETLGDLVIRYVGAGEGAREEGGGGEVTSGLALRPSEPTPLGI